MKNKIINLNMDFSKKIQIKTSEMDWQKSPSPDVLRKPLARANKESGHATSVVKYLPGAKFKQHTHNKGEEIFVLEGTFSDENGDYPQGSYLRNPDGTSHSPFSKEGCVLFVKLAQFQKDDNQQLVVNTHTKEWVDGIGGLKVMPLHSHIHEHTALVKWPKNEVFQPHNHFGGEEILVLKGTFQDQFGKYPKGTWVRSPHNSNHHPFVTEETIIWVKTGHLMV
ncbi:MAG: cupin domain-containing protein [Marinicellaceae bacterium]